MSKGYSAPAKHFARVNPLRPLKKSALQKSIGSVRAEVWERINRVLMEEFADVRLRHRAVDAHCPGVYDKLRRCRAGIEAAISYLQRCFGLRRCHLRGLDHFRAYVWSAIVAHNLALLARSRLELKPT